MGFQEDLEQIMDSVPKTAVTWMFSATMEKRVAQCAHRILKNPIEINVVDNQPPPNIKHVCVTFKAPTERGAALRQLVDETPDFFGLVFRRTRSNVRTTAKHFADEGYSVGALHGDLTQQQRDRVMKSFRNHEIQILFATDVASRGLDVSDVTHIVHFDISEDAETYTHRSGRTARAGKSGISMVFAAPEDHGKLAQFERTLKMQFEFNGISREECRTMGGGSRGREKSGRGGNRNWSGPSRIKRKYGKAGAPRAPAAR
jgi:ATP-dependent RNA helicase DeaD